MIFAYTDYDGTRVELDLGKYSVEVEESLSATSEDDDSETMLWVGRGISAVGLILVIVAIVFYIKKR